MVKSYLVATAAVGLVLALSASANAGGRGLGGAGPSTTPPGFSSSGGHNGFETFTHTGPGTTTTTERLPRGWDEGKAAWKSGLEAPNPILSTRPPGLSRH
jgi:hypothetical protein